MRRVIKNFSRFPRDERGNVAITFGMMVIPMVIFVGGTVDYGSARREQTKLQVAADAAALAAATGMDLSSQQRQTKAENTFAANHNSKVLHNVTPDITIESAAVTVKANSAVDTSFLRILNIDHLPIKVRSSAKKQASSAGSSSSAGAKVCMLALDPNSTDGIHIQGANVVNYTNCWGYTNSSQATAINANGNNATATGAGHCAVGSYSAEHNNFSPTPRTVCPVAADPFANVGAYELLSTYSSKFTPPAMPATCKAQNLSLKKGTYTIDPGRYCGGINLQAQATVTMTPGVYIMDNGTFNVQSGSSISGSNVMVYFPAGSAHMTIIGGGTVNLKGRTAGSSYEGFLFIAHPNAWRGLASNIQGGGTMNLEGMLYMPTQRIEVSGNGNVNGTSPYFAMVAKDFYFRGNGTFKMSKSTGGSAADIVPNLPEFATGDTWITQ